MRRRNLSIAIVGAGFSGICLAIGLKKAGFADFVIFDRGNGPGGVWRDNTYPGAACDAPSHLYSFSFEPNPDWSRRFAEQPEILDYLRHCVTKYVLTPHLRLRTGDGETGEYGLLVAACGQLSNPAVPELPGMDAFTGTMFHSSRSSAPTHQRHSVGCRERRGAAPLRPAGCAGARTIRDGTSPHWW